MPTLKAIHQIERRNEKGVLETIKPKAEFQASEDEAKYFISTGAAQKVKGKPARDEDDGASGDEKPLNKMNKSELIERANRVNGDLVEAEIDHQIDNPSALTNPQLVSAIQEAEDKLKAGTGMLD